MTALFMGTCIAYHLFLWLQSTQLAARQDGSGSGSGGLLGIGGIHFDVLHAYGASIREGLWDGGWQRLVLPMFMHGGLIHIIFNMTSLYQLGPSLEVHFGSSNFGTIYLLSGVGSTCMSLICGGNLATGASGAIFGMLGAVLAVKVMACMDLRRAWKNSEVRSTAKYIAILFAVCFLIPHVDQWGHLGGLLIGFLYGMLFEYWRKHRHVGLALILLLLSVSAASVVAARWMVFNPHYHVHLGLKADAEGAAEVAEAHFVEARRWARRWRSERAGIELDAAANQALAAGDGARATRYLLLMFEVGAER